MECEDGTLLEKLITKQPVPVGTAVEIATQICDGMEYVHKHGVIHRDLNARNVMLTSSNSANLQLPVVKILDFGIATHDQSDSLAAELTQPGQIVGNPLYMSPEQARGKELDGRSDIYSLGCLLFHMLSGSPPYAGNSLMEIIVQHSNAAVPSLLKSQSAEDGHESPQSREVFEKLDQIVAACMAKEPGERFSTMADVRAQLIRLKEEHSLAASPVIPPASSRQDETIPTSGHRDSITLYWTLVIAVTIMIGGTTWYYVGRPSNAPNPPQPHSPNPDSGIPPDSGKELETLKRELARNKKKIELTFATLTPQYFEALSKTKELRHINMTDCTGVTTEGLALMVKNKVAVRDFVLDGSDVNDEGLKQVAKLKGLQVLRLRTCLRYLTPSGIAALADCPTLQSLNLNDTTCNDETVAALSKSQSLFNLKMASDDVTDKAAANLSKMKRLTVLDFSETKLTDRGLKHLWQLPNLDDLGLRRLSITDAGLSGFKGGVIKHLYLAGCKGITDGAMTSISTMTSLKTLDLSSTSVTSKSLPDLIKLKNLSYLNIGGLAFAGGDKLELKNHLPTCKVIEEVNFRKEEH